MPYVLTPSVSILSEASTALFSLRVQFDGVPIGGTNWYLTILPPPGSDGGPRFSILDADGVTPLYEPIHGLEIAFGGAPDLNYVDLPITLIDDSAYEGDQVFTAYLTADPGDNPVTQYLARASFTIQENDPFSPFDDYGNMVTGSPTPLGNIEVGQTQGGALESPGDHDLFQAFLAAGHTYAIGVEGRSSGDGTLYDPCLLVYDAHGVVVASDDDGGAGKNSLVTFTPPEGDVYYIAAGAYNDSGTGSYRVTLSAGDMVPDDDYGMTAGNAGALAVGQVLGGTVDAGGDKDWFAVTLQALGTYTFAAKGSSSGAGTLYDPFLTIYDANGDLVASDDDAGIGKDAQIVFTAPAAVGTSEATYYVEARAFGGTQTGTYQVTLTGGTSGGANPSDDFATGAGNAGDGALGVGQPASGNVNFAADKDWFAVTLVAGTAYDIAVNGTSSGSGTLYDPFVRLIAPNGNVVGSDDDSGPGKNALLHFTPAAGAGGVYYVEAGAFSSSQTGTYEVRVTPSGSGSSEDGGGTPAGSTDDFASGAGTSPYGAPALGATVPGSIESAGDRDWFAVSLTAGTLYSFALNGKPTLAGTLADPFLSLYDPGGHTVLATDDDGGAGSNSLLRYAPATSGTYYIEARAYGATQTGTYQITLATESASVPATPGDDFLATTSTSGIAVPGQVAGGNIETGGDTDWFRVTLPAGLSTIALNGWSSHAGSLLDPFVSLYDANGQFIACDDESGAGHDASLQFTAAAGTYYIEARAYSGAATGTYQILVTPPAVVGASVPMAEPGDASIELVGVQMETP